MPQSCAVRLPAAVRAPAGWRNACTRAHTPSANAPSTSAKKSQPCSHPIIPTRGVYGPPRSVVGGQEVAGLTGAEAGGLEEVDGEGPGDRKSTRLNSSHVAISYAVFCLKKKNKRTRRRDRSYG